MQRLVVSVLLGCWIVSPAWSGGIGGQRAYMDTAHTNSLRWVLLALACIARTLVAAAVVLPDKLVFTGRWATVGMLYTCVPRALAAALHSNSSISVHEPWWDVLLDWTLSVTEILALVVGLCLVIHVACLRKPHDA